MIVLLRDGERAEEHGIYAKILQSSKESVIIGIRAPALNSPLARNSSDWVNVYCREGWESVIIEYRGTKEVVTLSGGG